jgi:nicotinamide phosphoribosyltransferase
MRSMTTDNIVLATDSYKLTHHAMYPEGTEFVYSYFESRKGARWDTTLWFGLQHLLQTYLEGEVVTMVDVTDAAEIAQAHFGDAGMFNLAGWTHVVEEHGGRLPLRIKAVPEGTVVPVGNVLMTVENTCPKCFWLTNFVESLLTHVWYPSTVATLSYEVKQTIVQYLDETSDSPEAVNFMLHDFGYRGATTHEAAAIGGAAHLVNFMGTDTLPAMQLLMKHYGADLASLAFSVPATEHSVMTAQGRDGEFRVLDQLIAAYPNGILSVVADSYDIYKFTEAVIARKDRILARNGRFVLRPDSVTGVNSTPESLTLRLVNMLWEGFGGTVNSKGFKVLNDQVRVLWGDVSNAVFGMGGGLLQKVNRDTQRFAFKSSAQYRNGVWHDVQKNPLDSSKKSKAGRLKLIRNIEGNFRTVRVEEDGADLLDVVFENGELTRVQTLDEIRQQAAN